MITTESIVEKSDIENLIKQVFPNHITMPFLFDEDKSQVIFVGMKCSDVPIGMAYGIVEHKTKVLFIHYLYIEKSYRNQENVLGLLEALLKAAVSQGGVSEANWFYALKQGESDVRHKLLSQSSLCEIKKETVYTQYVMNVADFGKIKKFRWLTSRNIEDLGYSLIKWHECSDSIKSFIREKESDAKMSDARYLSPFTQDGLVNEGRAPDQNTSIVLIDNESKNPVGWAICYLLSDKRVLLESYYMYEKKRLGVHAVIFVAHILGIMEAMPDLYEYFHFEVVQSNIKMNKFLNAICKLALQKEFLSHNLTLTLNLSPGEGQ